MTGKEEKTDSLRAGFDPAMQSEKIGFEPDQMQACGSCGRKNPPDRSACLYCGSVMAVDPTAVSEIRSVLSKPEAWEPGFNLILQPGSGGVADIGRASQILSLSSGEIAEIARTGLHFPIARVKTARDAKTLAEVLTRLGLITLIVGDKTLDGNRPPKRLRSINFSGDTISVVLFNSGDEVIFSTSEIFLAVEGVISESRVDQIEKRRVRGDNRVIDGSSSTSIDPVLDLYSIDDRLGYRILPTGFDFSCLGEEKGILSGENFKLLTQRIVINLPNLRYISSYQQNRQLLGSVWEIESLQENTGLRHTGLGQKAYGTVSSTSNAKQFTMFSRLQRQLL